MQASTCNASFFAPAHVCNFVEECSLNDTAHTVRNYAHNSASSIGLVHGVALMCVWCAGWDDPGMNWLRSVFFFFFFFLSPPYSWQLNKGMQLGWLEQKSLRVGGSEVNSFAIRHRSRLSSAKSRDNSRRAKDPFHAIEQGNLWLNRARKAKNDMKHSWKWLFADPQKRPHQHFQRPLSHIFVRKRYIHEFACCFLTRNVYDSLLIKVHA